ncbi:MAG TPA: hypothetical protein VFU01_10055 [Gemmatimonadaceae bacterium]|nr:hypothetical protein [Gemmatimonadaceae bacterium]
MTRRLALLLTLTPLALEAQTPDIAKLTFAWPEKMMARVEAQKYRERNTGTRSDTSNVEISYRMTAQRTGNEYIIAFDDFQTPEGAPLSARQELASLTDRLGALIPAYRVTAAGEFARLESTATLRAFIDSLVKTAVGSASVTPEARQMLQALGSDAVLASTVAQEWNALVGTWAGAELEVGEAYGSEGEEPIPILQGATIKFRYEFGVVRRLSCDSIAAPNARDCVELQMVSKPDSAALRQFLDRFVGRLMPDVAKELNFAQFDIENVISLVARPETLVPMSLVISKEVTAKMKADGATEEMYQFDVKAWRYSYKR